MNQKGVIVITFYRCAYINENVLGERILRAKKTFNFDVRLRCT
jgi:hypothetical protein